MGYFQKSLVIDIQKNIISLYVYTFNMSLKYVERYKYEIVIFLVLTLFRSIPEILTYPYLVGYDAPFYAGILKRFGSLDLLSYTYNIIFFEYKQPPLLFLIYYLIFHVSNSAIMTIKITTPIMYGLLGVSIFLFYKGIIVRNNIEAFYASIAVGIYYTTLGLSSGVFKNLLALDFFVLALYFRGKKQQSENDLLLFLTFAILTIFAHQLMSLLLSLIIAILLIVSLKKKELYKRCVIDFLIIGLGFIFTVFFMSDRLSSIISSKPSIPQYIQFSNYSFQTIVISTIGTFLAQTFVLLILLLFIFRKVNSKVIWKEVMRYKILTFWIGIALFFGFLPIFVYPYYVAYWHRWPLLLSIPLILLTIRLLVFSKHVILRPVRMSMPVKIAIVFLTMAGIGLISFPTPLPYEYYVIPTPTTLLMSSVPSSQMSDLEHAFNKVSLLMNSDTAFIAPEPIYGWALYYLDVNKTVYLCMWNSSVALEKGLEEGYEIFYMIWWKKSIYVTIENGTKIRDRLIISDGFQIIDETEYFYLYVFTIRESKTNKIL